MVGLTPLVSTRPSLVLFTTRLYPRVAVCLLTFVP
jgi:hypothetical protein